MTARFPSVPTTIRSVIDGDTIIADYQGQQTRIRLHGIDAPESQQPGGEDATRYLKQVVAQYQPHEFTLQIISPADRHQRVVAAVRADQDTATLNYHMVRAGHAYAYEQHGGLHPAIQQAEAVAQQERLGVWRDSTDGGQRPWEYRRQQRRPLIQPRWFTITMLATAAAIAVWYIATY